MIDETSANIKQIENTLLVQQVVQEGTKLKPVFQVLNEQFSYGVIRCVYMNFLNSIDV